MSRTLLVTYCAADKDPAPGDLPAIRRYRSTRIEAVAALAGRRQAAFRILSGEFGLLAPEDSIPWYDHLLVAGEIDRLAGRVAAQIADLEPSRVVFFTRSAVADPCAGPYRTCCETACSRAGVLCAVVALPSGSLTAEDLEVP
ncbi:MAG: hypothetical protein GY838_11000 [bacterium]|nr:hypothetical protein [bacterium]